MCYQEKNQEEVFTLSMNLLDRFLSLVQMRTGQLQLLASACMLIASKLKENPPIDPNKLVYYSMNTFTLEDLKVSKDNIPNLIKFGKVLDFNNYFINSVPVTTRQKWWVDNHVNH